MALTVEDGTAKADADALWSLADIDSYHSDRGNTDWTGTDAVKEGAIRRATSYLSDHFDWMGSRTEGRSQALSWPRSGVVDREGETIADDEIPVEIQYACAEAALRELVDPGSLAPDFTPTERLTEVRVGPITVKYDDTRTEADAARLVALRLRDLIAQFLSLYQTSRLSGGSYR